MSNSAVNLLSNSTVQLLSSITINVMSNSTVHLLSSITINVMSNSTVTLCLFMETHFHDRVQTIPGLFFLRRVWSIHLWLGRPTYPLPVSLCAHWLQNAYTLFRNKCCVHLHVQGKIISLELHIFWCFCYFAICFRVKYVLEVTSSLSSPLFLYFLHVVLLKSCAYIRLGAMIPPLSCAIYVVLKLARRVVL
jgi:hypothetical protein